MKLKVVQIITRAACHYKFYKCLVKLESEIIELFDRWSKNKMRNNAKVNSIDRWVYKYAEVKIFSENDKHLDDFTKI